MKIINRPKKNILVTLDQAAAAIDLAVDKNRTFMLQFCQEQMILMLNDKFGFGRQRCMEAIEAFQERMEDFRQSVEDEFDAETFRMSCREKQDAGVELAFTWERHDQALEPLINPEIWEQYTERYKGLGEWVK